MPETLRGVIERVTFHNPETGFAVLRVVVAGRGEPVTVVGNTPSVTAGEHLEAVGDWKIDREHGRQFRAESMRTAHPTSVEGIERYLASGAIRSVGPKLAERIVKVFGAQTLDIFDKAPDSLLHVHGIGPERLRRIVASWQEQREVRKIMLFLAEHGISSGRAVRIYRTYGQDSIARIQENAYRLADDIRGIGFKTADELAMRLGIDRNSPMRAEAAVRFALQELSGQGHCAYPESGLTEEAEKLVGIDRAILAAAIESGVEGGPLVREPIEGESWIYLAALHRAEVGLAASVRRILSGEGHPLPVIDVERAIGWVEGKLQIQLAEGQKEAVREACRRRLLVITGGPGVGKTTLVRSLLEIFEAKRCACVLAAPTGRAAKRLSETTGREAKTIHRLLEFDPVTGEFRRNAQRPLEGQLFVLDEVSMVDVVLGHQFFRAVPSGACVVLVGDADQLPSVGPGNVLADVIGSGVAPVARLTEIFRQAAESRIVAAAYAINQGRMPDLERSDTSDFFFIESAEPDAVIDVIVRLVKERVPNRFGLDPMRDIQVLSPMNRTPLGSRHLNEVLQTALNPAAGQPEIERFGWTYRVGDRVIQTENDYQRDVFNGDLGTLVELNRIEQTAVVDFDGRPVEYDFNDMESLSLAYVLSIHKSQGSEFPCVVIPVHTQHYVMLERNLFYTGVTRGRKLVVLVGMKKALGIAVKRANARRRYSALGLRLKKR